MYVVEFRKHQLVELYDGTYGFFRKHIFGSKKCLDS